MSSENVDARVVIIDNDSAPEQLELLRTGLPDGVRLRAEAANMGYGAAANRALAEGGAELLLVSNADVRPAPEALAALAAAASAAPDAGMVGPVFEGERTEYHARLAAAPTMLVRIFAGGFNRRPVPVPAAGEVAEADQPSGACFVFQRQLWERLGGFDEGFFLWYEDVDLALRARQSGARNLIVGSARVSHRGGEAFERLDQRRQQALRLDSLQRYIDKHHSGLTATLARPLIAISRRLRAGGSGG
jgi:N-acetylglucosaminyl-diphospho-decaprenol L-rhamnosyltransferase